MLLLIMWICVLISGVLVWKEVICFFIVFGFGVKVSEIVESILDWINMVVFFVLKFGV